MNNIEVCEEAEVYEAPGGRTEPGDKCHTLEWDQRECDGILTRRSSYSCSGHRGTAKPETQAHGQRILSSVKSSLGVVTIGGLDHHPVAMTELILWQQGLPVSLTAWKVHFPQEMRAKSRA